MVCFDDLYPVCHTLLPISFLICFPVWFCMINTLFDSISFVLWCLHSSLSSCVLSSWFSCLSIKMTLYLLPLVCCWWLLLSFLSHVAMLTTLEYPTFWHSFLSSSSYFFYLLAQHYDHMIHVCLYLSCLVIPWPRLLTEQYEVFWKWVNSSWRINWWMGQGRSRRSHTYQHRMR